jgi:hypothetical protein
MTERIALVLLLAFVWGAVWAAFLQWHPWGQWLVVRRTWVTVVIGVGVDLALLPLVIPLEIWAMVVGVFATSSIGVIWRSFANERHEDVQ